MAEVAPLLNRSRRQVQRLVAAYRKERVAAVAHGNRGHSSQHRIDDATCQGISILAQKAYAGANYQHLRDLLKRETATGSCLPNAEAGN